MSSSPNPLPIHSRPSGSSTGSSSSGLSYSSTFSTPPTFGSNYHPNSINTISQRTPSHPNPPVSAASSDTESSFVGTPFAFALERPYEYPFPSPATESCPNLTTSNSASSLGFSLPAHSLLSSPAKEVMPLPSVLPPPMPPTSPTQGHGVLPRNTPSRPVEGRNARMPLLLRRLSHAPQDTIAPVPPGLLAKARDLGRRKSISAGSAMRGHGRHLSAGGNPVGR